VPRRTGVFLFSLLLLIVVLSGCVISPRRTLGGGPTPTPTPTPSPTPTPTPAPAATGKLYVTSGSQNSIVRFDNAFTVNGNVAPAANINGAATTLSVPIYLALDSTADRLFAVNRSTASILVFDQVSTKTGNVAPNRTISGAATNLFVPVQPFLDSTRNLLYVSDDVDVLVFANASTANGNAASARDIQPGFSVGAIFVDSTNDRLFVTDPNGNAVDIYDNASTLNGSATTPSRQIKGASTGLASPVGLQIDGSGRLVVSNATPPSITVYAAAATANGNISPVATISGSNTGFVSPNQIAFDTTARDTLYVVDPGAGSIFVFTSFTIANGNLAPTRIINGSSTTLSTTGQNSGIALDVNH
jgi:6-phosphogluconolactonase (cycloisomerase 2 family)